MATNPRIPDSGNPINRPTGGMRPEKPKSGLGGIILALIVAGLLLAAVIYFMPRAPKAPPKLGAQSPEQPVNGEIQLTGLRIIQGPTGSALSMQGIMANHGQTIINGIGMDVIFFGQNGNVVGTQRAKVMGLKQEGQSFQVDDLTQDPLKPNDARPFRITVDRVPSGWNHAMPELKVALVTSHH